MDYDDLILVVTGPAENEKFINALAGIESLLTQEFCEKGDKQLLKRQESAAINSISNTESLVCSLLNHLETHKDATENILRVLSLCCQNLLTKLTSPTINKLFSTCSDLAEKSIHDKNWLILLKCLTVLKNFDYKTSVSILSNGVRRSKCLKIIQLGISIGKEEISDKDKQYLCAIRVLCVETLGSVVKVVPCQIDISPKFDEWFMLLFPLLFDENIELRKATFLTFETMKSIWLKNFLSVISSPILKEQIKGYAKVLVQLAETNQPDWVIIWCFIFELLGEEFSEKKNIEIINKLLQVEERAFRSNNMSTRYNAYVGWKFLVNKFIDSSIDDAAKRLKLLLQPLVSNNSKTHEISVIKFEVWWDLIVGLESCMDKNGKNIIYHFFNFCFGPVTDSTSLNKRTNTLPNNSLNARRSGSNLSPVTYYPLMTVRKMRGLDMNRTDALAQILNLDVRNKGYKLQCFKGIIISQPKTFLDLSKMTIYCVGQCTIVIVDSKELTHQEKRSYLKDIWKNLILHVKSVDKMPHSEPAENMDSTEKHDKIEMMKNLFRVLLHLNEVSTTNQNLLNVYISPILEIVLSAESGLLNAALTCSMYYFGTEILIGTPLLIMLDILLSPVIVSSQHQNQNQKAHNNTRYMVLLNRILQLGIGPEFTSIQFTQAVMKRLDIAVGYGCASGNLVKTIWILVAKSLTRHVGLGRDINQGNSEKADFKCLFSVLLFPVTCSKIFSSEQELIAKVWSQLFHALQQNVYSSNCTYEGNEICNIWCGSVYQELSSRSAMSYHEIFYIFNLVSCAMKQIRYQELNSILLQNSGEPEKCITVHILNCFQLLQLLVAYVQKLKEKNDMYYQIVKEYAECVLTFCDNIQECPISNVSVFFVDHIQFLLTVQVVNNTMMHNYFDTLEKVWNSFLYTFTKRYLMKSKPEKQTIIHKILPLLKLALAHSVHSLHSTTLEFCEKENIPVEENYIMCSSCKNSKENKLENSNNERSPANSRNGRKAVKDLLNRPLTKHQREMLKERRDDIPALYQDLTQDSQPSLIDITQDYSMDVFPGNSESEKMSSTTGENLSFRTALKSLEENNSVVNQRKQDRIEILDSVTDSVLSSTICDVPQETLEKKENGKNSAKTKTVLVIKRTPDNTLNSTTTSLPVELPGKDSQDFTDKNMSCMQSPIPTDSKVLRSNEKSYCTKKEVPIMIISNLKTGNPEIKNVTSTSQFVPEKVKSKGIEVSSCKALPKEASNKMDVNHHNKLLGDDSPAHKKNSKQEDIPDTVAEPSEQMSEVTEIDVVTCSSGPFERELLDSARSPHQKKGVNTNKMQQMTQSDNEKKLRDITVISGQELLSCGEKEKNPVGSCEVLCLSPRSVLKKSDPEKAKSSTHKALIFDSSISQMKNGKLSKRFKKKLFSGSSSLPEEDEVQIIDLVSIENIPLVDCSIETEKSSERKRISPKTQRLGGHDASATPHKMSVNTAECSPGNKVQEKEIRNSTHGTVPKDCNKSVLESEKNTFCKFIEQRNHTNSADNSKGSPDSSLEKTPLARNLNKHSAIADSFEVKEQPKNNSVTSVNLSCDTVKVSPDRMADQTEFVKSLRLMPQRNLAVNDSKKSSRISTRSEWARRFGSNNKIESSIPEKDLKDVGKDKFCKVIEGPQEPVSSNDSKESEDFIDSSQDNTERNDAVQTACFVKVPKLVLTPGSVVTNTEGGLVIKEKLSPVSYRLSNKDRNDGDDPINNSNSLLIEGCQNEVSLIDLDTNKTISMVRTKLLSDANLGFPQLSCESHSSSQNNSHSSMDSACHNIAAIDLLHSTKREEHCTVDSKSSSSMNELNVTVNNDVNSLSANEYHLPASESNIPDLCESDHSAPSDSNVSSPSKARSQAFRELQLTNPSESCHPAPSDSHPPDTSVSHSRACKESRTPACKESHSLTQNDSHSLTHSGSHSMACSESHSPAQSESLSAAGKQSHSPAGKQSHSPVGKQSLSPAGKESHSLAGKESHSPIRSESHSPARKESHSRAGKQSPSLAGNESHSPADKESHSPAGKESHSPAGKEPHSPIRSESHSPARKESHSPAHKESHSPAHKESHSPAGKESHSPAGKQSLSVAGEETHSSVCSESPTHKESHSPTRKESHSPTRKESHSPTHQESHSPTRQESHSPTRKESHSPTRQESHSPTRQESHSPTRKESHSPTRKESHSPTRKESHSPTRKESHSPTHKESLSPTRNESTCPLHGECRSPAHTESCSSTTGECRSPDSRKSNHSASCHLYSTRSTKLHNSSTGESLPTTSSEPRSDVVSGFLPIIDKITQPDINNEMFHILGEKTDKDSRNQKRKQQKPLKDNFMKRRCGRAAQMVGLALTNYKNQSEPKLILEDESDIIYVHRSDGQEKCPWVKCVPQSESSPIRTNLKRKRTDSDDSDSPSPPKKTVRFADPVMTQELHFSKKTPPENTYRVVRTKKGKVYIQKNGPTMSTRSKKFSSSSVDAPVWPSLKYSKHTILDIIEYLVDSPESEEDLQDALITKGIFTVGELCLLSELDISRLPIKSPQVKTAKFAFKKFEDSLRSDPEPDRLQELLYNPTIGPYVAPRSFEENLLSMNTDGIINFLREKLPKSAIDEVARGLSPSTSAETNVATEDKSSCTEFEVPCHQYCLKEAFKNEDSEQKSKLINDVLKVVSDNSELKLIVKELCDLCVSKASSVIRSDSSASEAVEENCVNVNSDVQFLGATRVLLEVLRYFNGQLTLENLAVEEVSVDNEISVSYLKELLTKIVTLHSLPGHQDIQKALLETIASSMGFEQVFGILTTFYAQEIRTLKKNVQN